jgi:hypothetical protein
MEGFLVLNTNIKAEDGRIFVPGPACRWFLVAGV